MEGNNRLLVAMSRLRKTAPIFCLLLGCLPLMTFFGCAIGATFETVGFMKGMTTQLKEREASLVELGRKTSHRKSRKTPHRTPSRGREFGYCFIEPKRI